jgi:hypothetical protein
MSKIAEFLSKWAFAIFLILLGVALLSALGCCIYVAKTAPFFGIVGSIGITFALAIVIGWLVIEIVEG